MPGLHEAISSSPPDNMLSTGSLLPGSQSLGFFLPSSFVTCGISNNLDGTEDMLIGDSNRESLMQRKMTATLKIPFRNSNRESLMERKMTVTLKIPFRDSNRESLMERKMTVTLKIPFRDSNRESLMQSKMTATLKIPFRI